MNYFSLLVCPIMLSLKLLCTMLVYRNWPGLRNVHKGLYDLPHLLSGAHKSERSNMRKDANIH